MALPLAAQELASISDSNVSGRKVRPAFSLTDVLAINVCGPSSFRTLSHPVGVLTSGEGLGAADGNGGNSQDKSPYRQTSRLAGGHGRGRPGTAHRYSPGIARLVAVVDKVANNHTKTDNAVVIAHQR